MSGRLEFAIPGDVVKALSPNVMARLHWAEKGRRVKTWQRRAWMCWLAAGGIQFENPVRITYTIRRSRRCDVDNAQAATKAITDGLKGREQMILDDGPQWLTEVLTRLECGPTWKDAEEVWVLVEETNG